jgi:hypothetical protein
MLKKLININFLLVLLFFLSSCSVYKVAYDYQPPKTQRGLSCIQGCQTQLNQSRLRCSQQYQRCSKKAEIQAKKNLPVLLSNYPSQLESWLRERERYERDLDWYEFRLDMAEARRDRYLDHCENKGKKRCQSRLGYPVLPYSRPTFNLPRPNKPTLENETARLRKQNCSQNCGSQSNYRLCYTSCGGVVTSKKVCVKNCSQ